MDLISAERFMPTYPLPLHRSLSTLNLVKLLVLIPTYNEAANIEPLLRALRTSVPAADILVLDDSSPDGTGKLVTKLARADHAIHLLERKTKEGLGKAYVAGFQAALGGSYTHVATMDADFSHDPRDLPKLLAAANEADGGSPHRSSGDVSEQEKGGSPHRSSGDVSEQEKGGLPHRSWPRGQRRVVIGSRYVPGGRIEGWGVDRYLLSATANLVTRTALGLTPKDSSAGFKVYPRAFLERLDLERVMAGGYAFQVEMLLRAQEFGFALREVPITFVDRRAGQSKIAGEASRSIVIILRLASQRQTVRQFVKFAIIGAGNTVVDWGIYFLMNRLIGVPKLGSKLTSFAVAATSSYVFNRRWTFRSTNPNVVTELLKFIVVAGIGATLNAGIFWLVVLQLGAPDLVGLIAATGLVMFWNFFVNKYWTFRS